MYNRDLTWKTKDDRVLKIKDMSSSHISNTINFIKKNRNSYIQKFGESKVNDYLYSFKQEIRFRKLNRLKMDDNDEELF